jgi:hypothetical protein
MRINFKSSLKNYFGSIYPIKLDLSHYLRAKILRNLISENIPFHLQTSHKLEFGVMFAISYDWLSLLTNFVFRMCF